MSNKRRQAHGKNFLTHCLGLVPAWLCVSKEHFKQPSCYSRKCPKNQSFSAKTLLVKATYSPAILRSARLSQYDFVWQLHISYSWFCESFAKQSCFSRKLSASNAKSVRSYPPSGVTPNYLSLRWITANNL